MTCDHSVDCMDAQQQVLQFLKVRQNCRREQRRGKLKKEMLLKKFSRTCEGEN